MPTVDDDESRDAPPVVIGAVAAGVAPLPFLAVYAVLFISRGTVHPVTPPDVGNSKTTELQMAARRSQVPSWRLTSGVAEASATTQA